MPDASQFTLGLFDSTALGCSVHTGLPNSSAPRGDKTDASRKAHGIAAGPPFDQMGSRRAHAFTHHNDRDDDDDDDSGGEAGGAGADRAIASPPSRGTNFHLDGDRALARGWPARARDNIAAIRLSKELDASGRAPTPDEQRALLRFIGFGASELAQNAFPLPGASTYRPDWDERGRELADLVSPAEYGALQRATQYAHYTPEPIIRALWRAAQRLGFAGGRVLEPGMGTGLFFALLPKALHDACRLTGIEYEPVTARIARLIHPETRVRFEDYTRSPLGGGFDLAIGNPPFADRIIRSDPTTAAIGLRLHDYFIARSIARLRPGGLALFVTSTGTMDKASTTAREHISSLADLVGAVRLPEGSMRATAGTDVVIDVLVFQRRAPGQAPAGPAWIDLMDVAIEPSTTVDGASDDSDTSGELANPERHAAADRDGDVVTGSFPTAPSAEKTPPAAETARPTTATINRYFAAHPEMVLGTHALRRGIYGPGLVYTCRASSRAGLLENALDAALARLPAGIFVASSEPAFDDDDCGDASTIDDATRPGRAADGATIKEGSYVIGRDGRLMQVIDGKAIVVAIRDGRTSGGVPATTAKLIRALLPIRDAVRSVLRAQAADQPWAQAQIQLRCAYSAFIRYHGPINHTVVTSTVDAETCEERQIHRRTNLAAFADDPDCWLVASIEDYDLETGYARMGAIFRERVVAPPAAPIIGSAADALAVTLDDVGHVDIDHLADLLETDGDTALAQLGTTVFRNPRTEAWETADAYLSGAVRTKLAVAEAAASLDTAYARNVIALRDVQPADLRPSDITARLGAPWIPTDVVEAFSRDVIGVTTRVSHSETVATWNVGVHSFAGSAAGTSVWGTNRRHAGHLLHDALNSATPQIFDEVPAEDGKYRRVLNVEATEAAKEKLARLKDAFTEWVWTDPDRTDRLARLYNDRFNNLVCRHFDGSHLTLPGASTAITLRPFQKRAVWRIVTAGGTYLAHAVGAGKTYSIAAAIMEQKRLGLIGKGMLVVPGHCLAQFSREFLQLYPTARILVADETNFGKDKRARFLARAATAGWDAIIITHSAFRFIAVPADFERRTIETQVMALAGVAERADDGDRTTRKRIEALKEKLSAKLEALADRRDDMVTIEEIGVDQVIVDEAQEFRKLSFATNRLNLKGVSPDGSQRAWDLFVKTRFVETKNPGRALIQASGTPITNTLGELFTILRIHDEDALRARGLHEFDAWASTFGDTHTELELQPSGTYKPVERFSTFINVPELIDMFRSIADVVVKDDLRDVLTLPRLVTGQRQLMTAPASQTFREHQKALARRIEAIEQRVGAVKPGDDILLSVITDGRHAAIDMRLIRPTNDDEPGNKLNRLVANTHRIWAETAGRRYRRPDDTPYPITGAGQMIFSDLGTVAVEATRGFSAYRWIKRELVRLGVPASQIAFMQDFRKSSEKQRLFNEFNAGHVRILIGSSETMGTGVNVQTRLVALHHLDVPWLPSQIEQREGRIERQGNQNADIEIYAYGTLGSMDATMWQTNERKARFIAAALSGDRSIRRIDDVGSQANQFAMAKAIASGDGRLMRKAGLDGEIARLRRQRGAHVDDQHDIRRRIHDGHAGRQRAIERIAAIAKDIERRTPTDGDAFTIEVHGRVVTKRKVAGDTLMTKIRMALLDRERSDWTVGRLAGFDLCCRIDHNRDRSGMTVTLRLARTDFDQAIAIDDDLTSLGLIARLEHVLSQFEVELRTEQRRQAEAEAQIAGYEPHLGRPFPLQAELDDKLAQMEDLDADLARTDSILAVDANRVAHRRAA